MLLSHRLHLIDTSRLRRADWHFNGGIFRWANELRLLYRKQDQGKDSSLSLVTLDEDYNVLSDVAVETPVRNTEDPRVVPHGNKLYVFTCVKYRQWVTVLDGNLKYESHHELVYGPENRPRKNWQMFFCPTGFVWKCLYWAHPWQVVRFDADWNGTREVDEDYGLNRLWKWGQIRGGSPPLQIGPHFYSFFHSVSEYMPELTRGRDSYVTGLLQWEASPPYRPVGISRVPILLPDMKAPNDINVWVTFPCGAVHDGRDKISVSYGHNDYELRVSEWSVRELTSQQWMQWV